MPEYDPTEIAAQADLDRGTILSFGPQGGMG